MCEIIRTSLRLSATPASNHKAIKQGISQQTMAAGNGPIMIVLLTLGPIAQAPLLSPTRSSIKGISSNRTSSARSRTRNARRSSRGRSRSSKGFNRKTLRTLEGSKSSRSNSSSFSNSSRNTGNNSRSWSKNSSRSVRSSKRSRRASRRRTRRILPNTASHHFRSGAVSDGRSLNGERPFRLPGLPEVHRGDDLAEQITNAARKARMHFENGDILVVAQKIISKAEGAVVRLSTIEPSPQAQAIAERQKKDPRLVEVILKESRRLVRSDPVLIAETRHGYVCANAGVDHSNVPGDDIVTLLPRDPDQSARSLAAALRKRTGKRVAVIISDTFGRPWRLGLTNVAIGASGVPVLHDLRDTPDRHGKPLAATILAVADELAAAAGLLMGKSQGIPVVLIRGYRYKPSAEPATRIIRPANEDLFR